MLLPDRGLPGTDADCLPLYDNLSHCHVVVPPGPFRPLSCPQLVSPLGEGTAQRRAAVISTVAHTAV
jgi:hypothetical protein